MECVGVVVGLVCGRGGVCLVKVCSAEQVLIRLCLPVVDGAERGSMSSCAFGWSVPVYAI